jgi:hypothetical protein
VSQPRGVPEGDEVGEPGHQHVEAADDLVVIGLSLSSSWGNGHATTYRALLGCLASIGQRVLFLERDVPW